jgi:hypothetical protein
LLRGLRRTGKEFLLPGLIGITPVGLGQIKIVKRFNAES